MPKVAQMLRHHRILALASAELHERYLVLRHEAFQLRYKAPADRAHQRRRRQRLPAMSPEELHNSLLGLQPRHIDIQVHPVDPLDRKLHVMVEDIGYALCYHRTGSGRAVLPLAGV